MPPATKVAASVRFRFHPSSPYARPSEVQLAATKAVLASKHRFGIIISSCGTGKTAMYVDLAMQLVARMKEAAKHQRVLILCYESQGVVQVAETLRKHTTLPPEYICVLTGRHKGKPHPNFCFMVTTYAMFSSGAAGRSEESLFARRYVEKTAFDLVICDEVHHVCAKTFKDFIEKQQETAAHMYGYTATLFRNESQLQETREQHEERMFGWFGPVLYRCTARQSEEAGLIAKIRRAEVRVSLTREFAIAHKAAHKTEKTYLASLNPQKLNAVSCLCKIHEQCDHAGIVFATHLLTAKVLRDVLGEGWEILSGSNAHGVEDKHTADINADIVKQFNRGELKGIISTAVGISAADYNHPKFRYLVVLDADGGSASAAQKLGRGSRTSRLVAGKDETPAQLKARRLAEQKSAAYYEINTLETADMTAAQSRAVEFEVEGYPQTTPVKYSDLVAWAAEEGCQLPFDTLLREMRLLKEVLSYDGLRSSVVEAKGAAEKIKEPTKQLMKKLAKDSSQASTAVMRELAKKRAEKLRATQSQVDALAKQEKQRVLDAAQLPAAAAKLFANLGLPLDVLDTLGVSEQVLLPPSDDEQ
mgnify:FL=1